MQSLIYLLLAQICFTTPPQKFENSQQKIRSTPNRLDQDSVAQKYIPGYVGACISVLNEHSSIREWVQYHLWLGINKIYLFDNGSNPPILLLLQDFLQNDQIEAFYFTNGFKADDFEIYKNNHMKWVANACLKWFGHRHKFMAILDVDEFIVFPDKLQMKLPNFLKDFENFGGLIIYRRFFGSNGHVNQPEGTVLESYTKCVENFNSSNKFIKNASLRPKVIVNMKYYGGNCVVHYCSTTKPMVNSEKVEYSKENLKSSFYQPTFQHIQLNHYFIKSYEDMKYKWIRKLEVKNISMDQVQENVDKYFKDCNEATKADCLEGIELSKMCCHDIKHIGNDFNDWQQFIV
eukprot:TRINITY_DN2976_c0_g1_i1.p1 TRINITY_DN2976_c0_g1~~TRINITY_DN2976_c0_g1_i1.p1  ORF type:complete len:347 (-),score=21.49 TRINITY_DN2976_c0_g1_i1:278-1318(-)